jgi:hypothetical protein
VSRELVIAFGPISAGILAGLIGRWDRTLAHYKARGGSLVGLGVALACLAFSIVAAGVTAGEKGDPATMVYVVQSFGVSWGLLYLLFPLLSELFDAVKEEWSPVRTRRVVTGLELGAVAVPVVIVALIWPWWTTFLWLLTSAVAIFLRGWITARKDAPET